MISFNPPLHIALNTWLVIVLSGILTTLAACQTPTTQPHPIQAPNPAQTPTFPNTIANPHNYPKVPVKTFALPADTQVPNDLTQGQQRILYVDPQNGNRIILTTPQKQEAFKDFAVQQLLPPAKQPYPLNVVDVNQIESVVNVRHNPNYCKVYELKIERPQKTLREQNLCDNLKYKVVINGEPWAELIATDVFFLAPPSDVLGTVGDSRYVFAPCEEACEQPLKVEIFKSPGSACQLKNAHSQHDPGLRKKPDAYNGLDTMDKVTEFEYDDCQNREILNLYYDASVRQLLDSVEKRLDVMKVETELLMRDVKAAYPDADDFQVSAVKVPAHYYERETAFQTQQYNDGFDEYDDYYDDFFDEYNDSYDDYDDYYDEYNDDYECTSGNCVDTGDIRKDIADFQNERLVQEVELLRKKVAWVEQTIEQYKLQGFQTQQFNNNDFYNQRRKLKNDFYNVDTSGGCYDFYGNNARPRNPKPRNDDNGGGSGNGGGNIPYEDRCHGEDPSISLLSVFLDADGHLIARGRINHAPETCGKPALDYSKLALSVQFKNEDGLILLSSPEITVKDMGFFEIKVPFGQYEYSSNYASNADKYAQQNGDLGRLAFLKGQVSLDSLHSFPQALVVKLATSIPEQDFETQADSLITDQFLILGGKSLNKGVTIDISHRNASVLPVVINFDIVDAFVPAKFIKHMRRTTVLPGEVFEMKFNWFGEDNGGKLIGNPYTYITQARLKSKNITRLVNTQRTRIKTGCLGYYKHYEKTLPLDRLQHILYRHSPHVFDDEFKAIFQNRLNDPTSFSKRYVKDAVRLHFWEPGSIGKESLYPKSWDSTDISSTALNLVNSFNPLTDKCLIKKDKTFQLNGNRNNLDLEVITSASTSIIVTAYPPDGPKAKDYYLTEEGIKLMKLNK